ncbi:diheme cytochrome c [hydrothermal vent metagenome]|uniref:Diheme cytochrome c n=1 Tax=hydrothermal vent metagenome TaxID=652676 RepID=A0A3B1BWN1_9ZZZZ
MKNSKLKLSMMFFALTVGLAAIAGQAIADNDGDDDGYRGRGYNNGDDDNRKGGFFGGENRFRGKADVATVAGVLYKKECGSCHFAYQPGLLPSRSWEKIMAGLEDHFGDNAELLEEDQVEITRYLIVNSADYSTYKASIKISSSLAGSSPMRITETPYFVKEHNEIPVRMWKNNPKVKSLSYCDRCHTNAKAGSFNEHDVKIPGFEQWDD